MTLTEVPRAWQVETEIETDFGARLLDLHDRVPEPSAPFERSEPSESSESSVQLTSSDPVEPFGWLVPPTDAERIAYLGRPQHRWLFWFSALAFCGVVLSLGGLAAQSYWTMAFFVPLLLLVVEQLLSLGTSTLRRLLTLAGHDARVAAYQPTSHPGVDLLLPTAGEDLAVLANTYRHVRQLRWPGELTVVVLDDAARAEVQALAVQHGFRYLARPGSAFKKAGNLQYGLERTAGDLVMILDADFVPRPDFLEQTVPYFEDGRVGIVQTPQYFSTDAQMSWLERAAGATQELFFRHIQPSRDTVRAAICVGTSAVYRRSSLDAIGGFPLIGHSEDVFTGVLMGRHGFHLSYLPVVLSRGRCPEDAAAFLAQQYRWCEGSMALLADPAFHQDDSMTLMQRMSFWAGFCYYLSTAMNAVLAPLPILIMVFFFPQNVAAANMLPLLGVLALWLVVFPRVSHSRWGVEVLRVQTLYGFAHLFCIADLVRGTVMEWVATGAAHPGSRSAAQPALRAEPARPSRPAQAGVGYRVQRFMVPYLAVTQLLVFVGLIAGTARFGITEYWANLVIAVFGGYVFLPVAWLGRGVFGTGRRARYRPTHAAQVLR